MYGIGNPFKFSPKELVEMKKTDKLVKQAQKEVAKNLKKIEKGEKYESTQEEYDKLMANLDEKIKKDEQHAATVKKAEKSEKKSKVANEAASKKIKEVWSKVVKTSAMDLADLLEKEIDNPYIYECVVDKILATVKEPVDQGWALITASCTMDLIGEINAWAAKLDYTPSIEFDDHEKEFANGYVKQVFGLDKMFPDSKVAVLDIYNTDSEKFNPDSILIFSLEKIKSLVNDKLKDKVKQVATDRKNKVVEVVDNAKLLPVFPKTDEEKLQEVVKPLDLGSPVKMEEPVDLFASLVANSSGNIKFVHKYIKDLLGEEAANSCKFYEDPNNKFINVVYNNQIYLVDPANIYGFGIWSIMALSANMINYNGVVYNDTILVPLAEKEIVKKIFAGNYIVSLAECEIIKKKYLFDNMLIYKFVDLSRTNSNKGIGTFGNTEAIKNLGKVLEKMLPMLNGFRFRIANIEAPDKFSLVSDSFVISPLASNGETALPSDRQIEITSESVLKKTAA